VALTASLLLTFVWRDIKVRYKQSLPRYRLGAAVAVFTATVYVLVIFGKFASSRYANIQYPILVFSGLLRCSTSPRRSHFRAPVSSPNVNLVTKVLLPRVLLPIAGVLVPAVDS